MELKEVIMYKRKSIGNKSDILHFGVVLQFSLFSFVQWQIFPPIESDVFSFGNSIFLLSFTSIQAIISR